MAKIIIPKTDLPSLSQEQTNRFRFRVINKNRNLASEWSTIGQIKRPVDDVDYELPNTFSIQAISNALMVSWEKSSNVYQVYDVYMKQYIRVFHTSGGGSYRYSAEELMFSESTSKNTAITHGIFSSYVGINVPTPEGAQILVTNFRYPRITRTAWNVLQCERVSNTIKIYLPPNITEFDNSYNANNTVYVDTTIAPPTGSPYSSLADMRVFNGVDTFTVNKSNPNYTILQRTSVGKDISLYTPTSGIARRIEPDPLFISSSYVDFA